MSAESDKNTSPNRYHYGVGRRKSSSARSKYFPSANELVVEVNKKPISVVFHDFYAKTILNSLTQIGITTGKIELYINGGGTSGQAEAARLAIAKSLLKYDENLRTVLRMFGYLTTDIRKVLSKKSGLRKNRKREQWSKR
jgi:small subunit ribosomal protein S9